MVLVDGVHEIRLRSAAHADAWRGLVPLLLPVCV